jgi:hypothetical protein
MSSTTNGVTPVARRVRAYFAPVDRVAGTPTVFDAAQQGRFLLDAPPAPWVDLGWCTAFARKAGTKVDALRAGTPAMPSGQVRTAVDATVSLEFESWGKLQLALAAGSEQMNLLRTTAGATANGSGGVAPAAAGLNAGSTASSLNVGDAASGFSVGELVAVDLDYAGQIGFVGSGASAAYVKQASNVGNDANYIRRVTLNVGRIVSIATGVLQLETSLLAGAPTADMKVSHIAGFVDREGGSFFQEWSGLFCIEGEQGDRVLYYYPRLQAMQGSLETAEALSGPLTRIKLAGAFRALPVVDPNDAAAVVCFRSYLPA